MIWRATAVVALALMLAIAPAEAARKSKTKSVDPYKGFEAMRFTIVRDAGPGCEPHCAEWIAAEGDVVQGSASAFKKVLKAAGKRKLPVFINSRGGSVQDALAIGRLIRGKGLDIAVARTDYEPCAKGVKGCKAGMAKSAKGRPNSLQAYCASSCAFIFAGGVRRLSTVWSGVGVHQMKSFQTLVRVQRTFRIETRRDSVGRVKRKKTLVGEKRLSSTTREAKTTDKAYDPVDKYLDEAGIMPALMPIIRATAYEDMHWLTPEEARATRMVTEVASAEYLVAEIEAVAAAAAPALAALGPLPADPNEKIAASASLRLGPFLTKEIDAVITLSHGRRNRPVRVEIALLDGKEAVGTSLLSANVQLGGGRSVEAVDNSGANPFGVLAADIPLLWFCDARGGAELLRISLDVKASTDPASLTPTVVHVARFDNAADLLASACPAQP